MREGQCFSCYDNTMFQLFGQTGELTQAKINYTFVEGLKKKGMEISCVTCGRKVHYVQDENEIWREEVVE